MLLENKGESKESLNTESPQTFNLYKKNKTKQDILQQFIKCSVILKQAKGIGCVYVFDMIQSLHSFW